MRRFHGIFALLFDSSVLLWPPGACTRTSCSTTGSPATCTAGNASDLLVSRACCDVRGGAGQEFHVNIGRTL